MNQPKQHQISHIIDMLKEHFQVAMFVHHHRFIRDFENLMHEQLNSFQTKEFEDFLFRFQQYRIRDDKNMGVNELRILLNLLSETFKYDTLFLCKDQISTEHPLLNILNLSIISETEFTDALISIEATQMATVNRRSLFINCILHLRTKFLSTLSPDFYLQFIKNAQGKSKRDRVSPEKMKPNTSTMADRLIRKSIEDDMQGAFGYGPSVWNAIIKASSPKKKSLLSPNFASIIGSTPIRINKSAKKEVVYESLVPLIHLLSPEYSIMTFDQWCNSTDDNDPSTYRQQYLNKRVKQFDKSGILFSVNKQ